MNGLSLSMLPRIPLVLILTGISMHHHWQVVYSRFNLERYWTDYLIYRKKAYPEETCHYIYVQEEATKNADSALL